MRMRSMKLGCAILGAVLTAAGCNKDDDDGGSGGTGPGGANTGGTAGAGGSSGLEWWATCGDPVCMTPDPDDPATPNCTTEQKGQPCNTPGKTCEPPGDSCGGTLLCTDSDPTNGGNCPISLARYKTDIHYLEAAELERVHGELLAMRLASWRYRSEPAGGPEHLGFLIDDAPRSAAVAASGRHVDLYGYASMATAAIQVQDRRIEALERQIAALREELAAGCR